MIDLRIRVKSNLEIVITILMGFMLIEANYWVLIPKVFHLSQNIRIILMVIIIAVGFVLSKFIIKKGRYMIVWLAYIGIILLNNREFAHGEYLNSARIIVCIVSLFLCANNVNWICSIPKMVVFIGIWNAVATIVFYFNNSLYMQFISRTYKTYQSGTNNGAYGYRAALADHYSQNGMYISIVLITLIAVFLCANASESKRKRYMRFTVIFLIAISVIALLLTGKRAPLLFGLATTIIVYYILNPQKIMYRTFKLMIAAVVLLIALTLLMEYVPQLGYTFERMQTVGTDSASMNRVIMWEYAIGMIKEHPILGVGWWGFRYQSGIINVLDDAITGCHNIYLEIFANCGVIGFVLLLVILIGSLRSTIKNIILLNKNNDLIQYKYPLVFSLMIQVFLIMYGFVGNFIFDKTFYFYVVAVAINYAFEYNKKKIFNTRLKIDEEK